MEGSKTKAFIRDYNLTEELREVLKNPLGTLIPNNRVNYEEIKKYINEKQIVIAVGDATTEILTKMRINPSVQIVDGKERRFVRNLPSSIFETEIHVSNPPAQISKESMNAIKSSIKAQKPVRIVVDGEEDLLTLPCILFFPNGTLIFYGQPKEGMVMVKIDKESKESVRTILNKMI